MSANTGIAWTDHTFNPWWGCTKVSPGCTNCYAESWDTRWKGEHWGKLAPRRFFNDKHWREPLKWNAAAAKAGKRARVFCASMADVFEDRRDLDGQRARLWTLIEETPHLDWQLLTKRPENVRKLAPFTWVYVGRWPSHVWIGTTVEDQKRAEERIPHLLKVPAVVRFLSVEPMLGPVDLRPALQQSGVPGHCYDIDGGLWHGPGTCEGARVNCDGKCCAPTVDWVIVGGESGPGARPFALEWARSVVSQCKAAGVPVFVKQLGAHVAWNGCGSPEEPRPSQHTVDTGHGYFRIVLRDSHGANPAEWPDDLRVREFPRQLQLEGPEKDEKETA